MNTSGCIVHSHICIHQCFSNTSPPGYYFCLGHIVHSDSHGISCPISDRLSTFRADSRFGPSHWETSLQSNGISHWLGVSLESALHKTNKRHPIIDLWRLDMEYCLWDQIIMFDSLVQEKCNSSALAMELHLSCTSPSMFAVSCFKINITTSTWLHIDW